MRSLIRGNGRVGITKEYEHREMRGYSVTLPYLSSPESSMYNLVTPKACSHHNHNDCISKALTSARQLCDSRGVRLTSLREQVLELVWQSHKPLGAYTLMDMLAKLSTRRVAPPTVYRVLDFLLEEGLIHRINSLNAYIGCPSPEKKHQNHFLICKSCGVTVELENLQLNQSIFDHASGAGFSVTSHNVEINGLCANCQNPGNEKLSEI